MVNYTNSIQRHSQRKRFTSRQALLEPMEYELYILSTFSTSSKIRLYDLILMGGQIAGGIQTDSTQDEDEDGDGMETIHKEIIQMNSLRMIQRDDTDGDGYGDNPDVTILMPPPIRTMD